MGICVSRPIADAGDCLSGTGESCPGFDADGENGSLAEVEVTDIFDAVGKRLGTASSGPIRASGTYFVRLSSGKFRLYPAPRTLINPMRPSISGYMDSLSYAPGDLATVYLSAPSALKMKVILSDAAGDPVDAVEASIKAQSPATAEPWSQGFGFKPTFKYHVPSLPSGVYFWERSIPFVVRDTTGAAEIAVVYPSNTINAYTLSGGKSLYKDVSMQNGRAYVLSFQRPQSDDGYSRPFFAWLRGQSLSARMGFLSDMDLDRYESFADAKLLIIAGHSEYWTRQARRNFDRFVASGKTALVLSGNSMWWQVRYDDTRTRMVCYKDSALDTDVPDSLKTIVWASSSLGYPILRSIGSEFGRGGYGSDRKHSRGGYTIKRADSPLLKGTGLRSGDFLSLPTSEYDGAPISGLDADGYPVPDSHALGDGRIEIVGFDGAYREKPGYGTFTVLRPHPASGLVINAGSTDWCASAGIDGQDSARVRRITLNAIHLSLENQEAFAEP